MPAVLADRLLALALDLDRKIELVTDSKDLVPAAAIELVTSSNTRPTPLTLEALRSELLSLPREARASALAVLEAALPVLRRELESRPPEEPPVRVPAWVETVCKQLTKLPRRETRLQVLHMLLQHQQHSEEADRRAERQPTNFASDRARAQWERGRTEARKHLRELEAFFGALPPDLVAEARDLRIPWGTRGVAGATRSYESILVKMREPRVERPIE